MSSDEYVQKMEDFILSSASRCFNCNVCFTQCPLDKSLVPGYMINGPSGIVQSVYYAVKWDLFHGKEKEEILDLLYCCTTCKSCEITCKDSSTGLPLLKLIESGRKLLVEKGIGPLPSQRAILKSIYAKGNPYNKALEDRLNWLGDIGVKQLPANHAENLYYVGCAPSYDPALHHIARNLVKLLKHMGIDFGILDSEKCCGCTAKRLGDEYLFQDIMTKNASQFVHSGVSSIFTTSPHCFNTFNNEYEGMGNLETKHYTQLLHPYFRNKKVEFKNDLHYIITYHDPCYLSKHNAIYEEPREILRSIPNIKLVEMENNRNNSLCCGGGGGRMWSEAKEENALANIRVKQAISTGANILAVSCPWCFTMLNDATKSLGVEDKIQVMDICEILLNAVL